MKNKFLILTLCFTIFISSLNINKSYADTRGVSVPMTSAMVAVISSVAVASGIKLSTNDDLLDICALFDKVNSDRQTVKDVFESSVKIMGDKVVSVGKDFLELCKNAFDVYFSSSTSDVVSTPFDVLVDEVFSCTSLDGSVTTVPINDDLSYRYYFVDKNTMPIFIDYKGVNIFNTSVPSYFYFRINNYSVGNKFKFCVENGYLGIRMIGASSSAKFAQFIELAKYADFTLPYTGGYSWDNNISANLKNDSLDIGVPKNPSDLIGLGVNGVLNPSYPLTNGSDIVLPDISNPSIEWVEGGITSGTTDSPADTPTDTPTTWDWLISLVVPSSTYWQDTFDTFFTNIGNAFPMININRFKDLCINGVPPKDIEVTIMGAKGKIFNTEHLNSVIGWLQPIVSAFMAFLLMLYNYRKVYKLIRGFEPFSGIADGQSVGEVKGKMDGAMPEMGGSSFVGPSTASTWSDGQSVTRGSIQSRYYGRNL